MREWKKWGVLFIIGVLTIAAIRVQIGHLELMRIPLMQQIPQIPQDLNIDHTVSGRGSEVTRSIELQSGLVFFDYQQEYDDSRRSSLCFLSLVGPNREWFLGTVESSVSVGTTRASFVKRISNPGLYFIEVKCAMAMPVWEMNIRQ